MKLTIFAAAIAGLITATIYAAAAPVTVNLQDAKGQSVGTAILTESKGGVAIRLNLKNLPPGEHAALMIHAKADDLKTDPAGNAGDRIACGTITK